MDATPLRHLIPIIGTIPTLIFGVIFGIFLLTMGAESFVKGASALAERYKIPKFLIGLSLVSLGTSLPEIFVNVISAWSGKSGLAIGNVVGSNILNTLCVLGICAIIAPLVIQHKIIKREVPVMLFSSFLFAVMAFDGKIERVEAFTLVVILVIYTLVQVFLTLEEIKKEPTDKEKPKKIKLSLRSIWFNIILGLCCLISGADILVHTASSIAKDFFQVSDLLVGLTIVAIGTSLPELAASIASVRDKEPEMAVGNVIGSNIYNILAVIGFTGLITEIQIPALAQTIDIPVMVISALLVLPVFLTNLSMARWEGFLFLTYYILYMLFVISTAMQYYLAANIILGLGLLSVPFVLVILIIVWRQELSPTIN